MRRRQAWANGGWRTRRCVAIAACGLAALALAASPVLAQSGDSFDDAPIHYTQSQPTNGVSRLQKQLDGREVRLQSTPSQGYLAAILEQLEVPLSTPILVFSKTSIQSCLISPLSLCTLYSNDNAYVGWVQGGPELEISTADPQLGAVFYTLSQDRDGLPVFSADTFLARDESPLEERWGGWYVTETHGRQYLLLPAKEYVYRRLNEILRGRDKTKECDHLSVADRRAILQILRDTKPDFATRADR